MSNFDDLDRLRLTPEPRGNRPRNPAGSAAFVGRVTTAAPQVGKFMMVRRVQILGEVEPGTAPDKSDLGLTSIPTYLIGPDEPEEGDHLIVRRVLDRWATGFRNHVTGPTVIDPPCADGTTNPDAELSLSLLFGTPDTNPPYPSMTVSLFPDHTPAEFGHPAQYNWLTGLIRYPVGSSWRESETPGEGNTKYYFEFGQGCGSLRPFGTRYACSLNFIGNEQCDIVASEDGTEFNDMSLGPVVVYALLDIVVLGFHGHD